MLFYNSQPLREYACFNYFWQGATQHISLLSKNDVVILVMSTSIESKNSGLEKSFCYVKYSLGPLRLCSSLSISLSGIPPGAGARHEAAPSIEEKTVWRIQQLGE